MQMLIYKSSVMSKIDKHFSVLSNIGSVFLLLLLVKEHYLAEKNSASCINSVVTLFSRKSVGIRDTFYYSRQM